MGDLSIFGLFGLMGVALYLGAYAGLQFGLLRGSALSYTVLNLVAAASVLFSLFENWNVFSALIQIFWIAISIVGIVRRIWLRARLGFSLEELGFLSAHMPTLPPIEAHRLTRLATWESCLPGTPLARQGMDVGGLAYLASGKASVTVDGRVVAELGAGTLVGEMTLMHGGPATADVVVIEPARVMRLPRARILPELTRSPDLALALGQALQTEVQRKLRLMNAGGAPATLAPAT